MKKLLYIFIITATFLSASFGLSSCRKEVGTTAILILDSVRHYYPIVMGEKITMIYRIANIGKEPFVITDIQPSCGCSLPEDGAGTIIPPGAEGKLTFIFDTYKNVGYVRHTIRIYGNIAPHGVAQMVFDCNVVPPTTSSVDYEENYYERNAQELAIKGMIEGGQGQKGYFTDEGISDRNYEKYPWLNRSTPKR